MHKHLFAAAFCCLAASAHAQSSVTLYGIIDMGFRYNTNAGGKQQYAVGGGNESASRFGLQGSEDLGGGYRAIFTLENGFYPANGTLQAGLIFGRQAYVGLDSPYGTLTIGRQYLTLSTYLGPFESGSDWAARGAGYGYHPGGLDDVDGTERANNAIKYVSPRYHGLQVGVTYSLGGVAGNFTQNQIYSFGIDYGIGPFKVAAAYLSAKNPNYSLWGNNATSSAAGSNITSPVFSGYASAGSQKTAGIGLSYALGPVTLGGIYTNTRFDDLGATPVGASTLPASERGKSVSFNTGEVNLKYRVTPALQLGLAYIYTRVSSFAGQSGASYQQWNAGASYTLSRRTDLYLTLLHESAGGFDSTRRRAVAALTSAIPSMSDVQTAITFGLRHQF